MSMEVKPTALLGIYDRPTDQPTDGQTSLPIRSQGSLKLMKMHFFLAVDVYKINTNLISHRNISNSLLIETLQHLDELRKGEKGRGVGKREVQCVEGGIYRVTGGKMCCLHMYLGKAITHSLRTSLHAGLRRWWEGRIHKDIGRQHAKYMPRVSSEYSSIYI